MKITKMQFRINLTIYNQILTIYIEFHLILMQNYLRTTTELVAPQIKNR